MTKNSKTNGKAAAPLKEAAKSKVIKLAASTSRIFARIITGLAGLHVTEANAKAAAEAAKVAIEKAIDSIKSDWRAVAGEHKDKAERKALAVRIHKALQQDHGLTSPRASEMLDKVGLGGFIRAKHTKERVALPEGLVESVFDFIEAKLPRGDMQEAEYGLLVRTTAQRTAGKAREVYPTRK